MRRTYFKNDGFFNIFPWRSLNSTKQNIAILKISDKILHFNKFSTKPWHFMFLEILRSSLSILIEYSKVLAMEEHAGYCIENQTLMVKVFRISQWRYKLFCYLLDIKPWPYNHTSICIFSFSVMLKQI